MTFPLEDIQTILNYLLKRHPVSVRELIRAVLNVLKYANESFSIEKVEAYTGTETDLVTLLESVLPADSSESAPEGVQAATNKSVWTAIVLALLKLLAEKFFAEY